MNHFNKDFNVIYLRVIQGCNLNCAHCFTLGDKDPYALLDYEVARSFLRQIKNKVSPRKATMYIHGGETFLAPHEHLKKINQIIREELTDTVLNIIPQTNLMYTVDEEYVNLIKQEYNNEIGVSWDYKIRFGSDKSDLNENLFFKNFKFLIDRGVNLSVAITVQKHLLKSNILEILPKFEGAKSIDFEFLTIFDEKTKNLKVRNDEWADFYMKIVDYYAKNKTTWSLPQVDLFTKSLMENKVFNCKCNCCQHRTFTLNCNGSLGLCPDEAYVRPLSDIIEFTKSWESFEMKARTAHLSHITQEIHPMCFKCEFYDVCGGNCEQSLFDEDSDECPLSKKVIKFQHQELELFKNKLKEAKDNLLELR